MYFPARTERQTPPLGPLPMFHLPRPKVLPNGPTSDHRSAGWKSWDRAVRDLIRWKRLALGVYALAIEVWEGGRVVSSSSLQLSQP